jgi:hypothetical protein
MPTERYGLAVFVRFFEQIVELCQAAGRVWGQELYFDGTAIRAHTDIGKLEPRPAWQARQHVQALFRSDPKVEPSATPQDAEHRVVFDFFNTLEHLTTDICRLTTVLLC